MNLCQPSVIKDLLQRYGTELKKGFGQNFLITPSIPEQIAEQSADGAREHCCALEIGPGIGALTQQLSKCYEKVVAVEIDRSLMPVLDETMQGCDNVKVLNEDFMKTDMPSLLSGEFQDRPVHVCANLPYYITTPVLMKILDAVSPSEASQIKSVTIMVQKEVAQRICASAGSSEYGALSVAVAMKGEARVLFHVSPGSFMPPPKVSSSVVSIRLHPEGAIRHFQILEHASDPVSSYCLAQTLFSRAFLQRRKTLVNALSDLYPKELVVSAISDMGLRPDIRGEKLSAEEYIMLAMTMNGSITKG